MLAGLDTISDEDMGWALVDAVKSYLTDQERTAIFIELGCGESYLAITRILTGLIRPGWRCR